MVHLIRPGVELLDAALIGDDALAQAIGHDVAPGWISFHQALQPTRDGVAGQPEDFTWGPRFFVIDDPPTLVGWGGFKGEPRDGAVELGYEIAESSQGRGLATEVTRQMLAEAFTDPEVDRVLAHTLAEANASNRVLEKNGFVFDGEVVEGDETVWRFVRSRA